MLALADVEICCWSDLPSTTDSIFRILWSSQAGSKQGRSLDWWSNSSGVALAAARSFQNCQSQTCRVSAKQVAYAPCSSWSPERLCLTNLLKSEQRWSMISNWSQIPWLVWHQSRFASFRWSSPITARPAHISIFSIKMATSSGGSLSCWSDKAIWGVNFPFQDTLYVFTVTVGISRAKGYKE